MPQNIVTLEAEGFPLLVQVGPNCGYLCNEMVVYYLVYLVSYCVFL